MKNPLPPNPIAPGSIIQTTQNTSSGNSITNPVLGDTLQGLTGEQFLQKLIPSIVGLIITVGVVVFFFMLLFGAIQWISSGGDKQAVESARGRISNALIGLVVLFSTFAIVKLIEALFPGLNILTLDIGPLKIQ